jgi:CheY-like chemotaxis protein
MLTFAEIYVMKILLVDNDPVYIGLMAEVLRLHSFNCGQAPNGEVALDMLQKQQYDLVISDISMPKMNGMNLYKNIRGDEKLKSILFAWNSGYRELRDIVEVENPSIDFKLDKAMPMPSFLYFITSLKERLEQSRSAVIN